MMRTSPAPRFGISRSTISKSPPGFEICAAFIGAIPTFVVAIIPPLNFQSLARGPRHIAFHMDYDYHPFTILDTCSHGLVAHFLDRGEEIPRGGVAGVGIADLMKEAGLTVGGFYKHFKSRDALLQSVVSRMVEFTCLLLTGLLRTQIERRCYVWAGPSA